MKLILVLMLALAITAGIAAWVWYAHYGTYHYAEVDPGVLYRDGNRGPREFANMARRARPRTVIALVDDDEIRQEPFREELEYCRQAGIAVERIPIPLGGWPTGEQVRHFLAIASDKARQPVLVHCAQGVRRTGMMVAAYQQSVLAYDKERAKAAVLTFGHSRRSIGDVERFIEIYDAQRRDVTRALPPSNEGGSE